MKFKTTNHDASSEGLGFGDGVALGLALPYLIVIGLVTVVGLVNMISKWRDSKRSPAERLARKLDRLSKEKNYLWYNNEEFPDMWGKTPDQQDYEWGYHLEPSSKVATPRLSVDNIVSSAEFIAQIAKLKSFAEGVAKLTDTNNCGPEIDKIFKKSFGKSMIVEQNKCMSIQMKREVATWPTHEYFAHLSIPMSKINKAYMALIPAYTKLKQNIDEIIKEETKGAAKEELEGRVTYVRTCEFILSIHDYIEHQLYGQLDRMAETVDVVPVW